MLLVSGNNFQGQLNNLFSDGAFSNLLSVDIGDNDFTGGLPFELFESSMLTEFIASSNCFTGSLSSAVCSAVSLITLDLSGSHGGKGCTQSYPWPFTFHTFGEVAGSIPECIFESSTLQLLSLSGNGMRSRLSDIPANSQLVNLNLAYNRLEGTIPLSFQQHSKFAYIDLSYNRLSGTIEHMVFNNPAVVNASGNATLLLESNRLSGNIPQWFQTAESINILGGNIFDCAGASTLPAHDPNAGNYVCGTHHLFAFLLTAVGVALARLVIVRTSSDRGGFFGRVLPTALHCMFWTSRDAVGSTNFDVASAAFARFRRYAVVLMGVATLLFLPLYLGLKFAYSSHTYQYGWLPSIGFMQDSTPATALLVVWLLLLPLLMASDLKMGGPFRLWRQPSHSKRHTTSGAAVVTEVGTCALTGC